MVEELEVADAISKVATTRRGQMENVPAEPVMILSLKREAAAPPAE